MFQPDEWQQKALLTWYSVDNPLHLDPRHPCIKLAGEAGEILDLYGKHEYKPNFSWWNCKRCKRSKEYHMEQYSGKFFHKHNDGHNYYCTANEFIPLILDELGDYSYYLRILAYQKGVTFEDLCKGIDDTVANKMYYFCGDLLYSLSQLSYVSSEMLLEYTRIGRIQIGDLKDCVYFFLAILDKLDTPLEQVLELNYKKLNLSEDAHGWKYATIKNRS